MNILKKGMKQKSSNWNLAKQEGNKIIEMLKIKNIEIILLCSALNAEKKVGRLPHLLIKDLKGRSVSLSLSIFFI